LQLIKTSLLNGVAVVIKMAALFGINKILAIYVGPSGFALIGQFQNIVQIVTTFASGAVNTGVTKYTAEYFDEPEKQQRVWLTAGTLSVIGSMLTIAIVIVFREEISVWLLHDPQYQSVFLWFAVGLMFFVLNSLLLAILNGKSEVQLYVIANIVGSLISFGITVALSVSMGLWGALVAVSIFQSGAFFSTLFLCRKTTWFRLRYLFGSLDMSVVKNLSKYTLMAITSAICAPIANILVRNHLSAEFGAEQAGYWEAMTRLSGAYLLLFTSVLSVYYLPKYAELNVGEPLRKEVLSGYKIILPVVFVCCAAIYLLRDLIITLLFTGDFIPMRDLFLWYQIGDFIKIGSWILAFIMLGKTMTKSYVSTEIIFTLTYLLFVYLFTEHYGMIGTSIAYAINYLLYWPTLYFIMRSGVFRDADSKSVLAIGRAS